MERLHRIFANTNPRFKAFLDRQGIPYEYEESIVGKTLSLVIPESSPYWPTLSEYLATADVFHTIELSFTEPEVREAEWCRLGVNSHFGYPQPDDDFGYLTTTYDPSRGCRVCGTGLEQVAPFRFRKAPTQRRSHILQLNWVFDEFFVSAQARSQFESAGLSGASFQAPVIHTSSEEVPDWFQIQIEQILPPLVKTDALQADSCPSCHRTKFNHPCDRMLELIDALPASTPDIVKTAEWFGSGGSAARVVLVSKRFVTMARRARWRGIHLEPVIATRCTALGADARG